MEERTILSIYGGILSIVMVRATWSVLGSVPVLISKLRYVVDTHLTRIFCFRLCRGGGRAGASAGGGPEGVKLIHC